jgi:hypothetical protein
MQGFQRPLALIMARMLMPIADIARGRRLLVAALLLWLLVGLLAYASRRYLYNVLFGPFPISRAELLSLDDSDSRAEYYVTVAGDDVDLLFPRAYSSGRKPYSMYGLLRLDQRRLLVRLPAGQKGLSLSGTLEHLSAYERQNVLAGRGACLPFRLEATRYFRTIGWLLGVLPLAALAALAAVLTWRGVPRQELIVSKRA